MTSHCSLCRAPYEVSDADLAFYEAVSPRIGDKALKIPAPTLCPQCRNQRRMAWRNDRTFHRRKSSKSGQEMLSLYPEGTPFPVFHSDEWWSDSWDPLDYGQDYDFSRPFFEQWQELMNKVPRRNMDLINCENSQYCNYCGDDKSCYLDIAGEGNEDSYYNLFTKYSKDCADCTFVYNSQLCYESIQCYDCYDVRFSQYLDNCANCQFCFDCKGCKNCLFCINQRDKEYCILNEQHTKEEYEAKLEELPTGSSKALKQAQELWEKMRIDRGLYRDMYVINCQDCFGNNIKNSKNCFFAFNAGDCEDCKYLYDVLEAKNCQDLNYSLYHPEFSYELISTLQLKNCAFCMATHYSNNLYYCDLSESSHDLFGCIGLHHKEYCILNKQYSKEEYEELLPKIIEHMISTGEWGQFFPIEISPFGYNETVAQEYMPLQKGEITGKGWKWSEDPEGTAPIGSTDSVPDHIADVSDDICDIPLTCSQSGKAYKIIEQELKFYRQQGIPVPRSCALQRHTNRNAQRLPRQLWARECDQCGKAVQTAFAPGRGEKVCCEECYLKFVY